jgi:hypothetical protein
MYLLIIFLKLIHIVYFHSPSPPPYSSTSSSTSPFLNPSLLLLLVDIAWLDPWLPQPDAPPCVPLQER